MNHCGTERGYRAHIHNGSEKCQPCKDAHAAEMRKQRARRPEAYSREEQANAARHRALARLAAEQPNRFRVIYFEELDAAGVDRR